MKHAVNINDINYLCSFDFIEDIGKAHWPWRKECDASPARGCQNHRNVTNHGQLFPWRVEVGVNGDGARPTFRRAQNGLTQQATPSTERKTWARRIG